MALLPPKINVGADGPKAWLQAGTKYGRSESGPFQTYAKEGTLAEVEDLVAAAEAAHMTYTVTRMKAGLARIEIQFATPSGGGDATTEVLENIWEFEGNEVNKDLLEADFPNSSYLGAISAENKAILVAALEHPDDFKTSSPAFTGGDAGSANSMYLLKKNGVTSFPVDAHVIRHTQVVSNQYIVQASFNNAGRLFSRDSMYSIEGVPTTLLFAVPTSTGAASQFIETSGDLLYGWRKVLPTVTRQTQLKWRISQIYQFGLWSRTMYDVLL